MAAIEPKNRHMVKKLLKREDGVVALEFVILFPLFLLLVAGVVEFGHLWYMRHALTNATREGARAAVVYYVQPSGSTVTREQWAESQAKTAVQNYLNATNDPWLKSLPEPVITLPQGSAATGNSITVRMTSPSSLLVLDKLINALQGITVSAETTMRFE